MHPILAAEAVFEPTHHLCENRRALRQLARCVAIFGAAADGAQFHASLRDLSRRGVRIRSEANLVCGEFVTIDADESTGLEPLECRIVRVQLVESSGRAVFEYGLQIAEPSRDQGHRWFLYFCYGGSPRPSKPQL